MSNKIKFIDLFAGVGGFHYGLLQASDRYECVWKCELDKYANMVYNYNYGSYGDINDIREVNEYELPDFDMLCAGFPCQAFSIAGKRRGFEDTRGTLFFEIARIVKAKKPKVVLLENVKGLLNHQKGETFSTILQTMVELGYSVEWMVLNSKFFGVPQNRERVFIICCLTGSSKPEILPFREDAKEISKLSKKQITVITQDRTNFREHQVPDEVPTLKQRMGTGGNNVPMVDTARCLDSNMWKGVTPEYYFDKHKRNIIPVAIRSYPRKGTKDVDGERTQNIEERDDDISNTVSTVNKDSLVEIYTKLRRLTPIECERLQGFPDNWTAKGIDSNGNIVDISDTQRYKQLGNSLTTFVVREIGKKLLGVF